MPYDTMSECLADNSDYPGFCDEAGTVRNEFGGRRWPGRSTKRRRRKSRKKRRKSKKKKRRRKRKRTKKRRR